jgi:hypothetical protein
MQPSTGQVLSRWNRQVNPFRPAANGRLQDGEKPTRVAWADYGSLQSCQKKIEIRFAIWSDVHTVLQPWAIDDYTSAVILINLCGRLSRHLGCQCRLQGFGYWKY